MNNKLKIAIVFTIVSLVFALLSAFVLINNISIPPFFGVILSPLSFFSVPCTITGIILIISDLFYPEVDKKGIGNYIMYFGIAMFFIGIYGFSTNGLSFFVSKVAEFSFFFGYLQFLLV